MASRWPMYPTIPHMLGGGVQAHVLDLVEQSPIADVQELCSLRAVPVGLAEHLRDRFPLGLQHRPVGDRLEPQRGGRGRFRAGRRGPALLRPPRLGRGGGGVAGGGAGSSRSFVPGGSGLVRNGSLRTIIRFTMFSSSRTLPGYLCWARRSTVRAGTVNP